MSADRSRRSAGPGGPRRTRSPRSTEQALADAAAHGRAALAELLAAGHALLDGAALASAGTELAEHAALAPLATWLERAGRSLERGARPTAAGLIRSVAEALDAEIARWEERSRSDPEARAVLRAFLGVREVLWEFGLRPLHEPEAETRAGPAGSRRARVERVPIEG
jgi:hypothetical protein